MINIRTADPSRDAAAVAEIYRPYVEDTIISFEEIAPSATEMKARIEHILEWTPWLVAEVAEADADPRIVGYAYASRHRERAGYRWSVDISVYVDRESRGRGVGRSLYAELVPTLRRQRFVNAYAGIGLPNDASVAIHELLGMTRVAVYEKVGWKLGRWVDVAWYAMRLSQPLDEDDGSTPPEPMPFSRLSG